jgi:acetylornithine deacetylase/succinyl-diaminopimelate desuccinylase-like protein
MIFVRHDGISHNPREHMDEEHLKKPLKLLEEVLRDFAY